MINKLKETDTKIKVNVVNITLPKNTKIKYLNKFKMIKPKNNRIIKFRAWDKETEHMVYPIMGVASIDFGGGIWEQADNRAGEIARTDWILMQFTGLLDKNGKEIYEGDIVKDNSGAVYIQGLCNAEKMVKQPTSATTDFLWEEVIGNIYENPDLLK